MCLVVSTDDPSIATEQVKTYLTDNGIAWEKTAAPAPLQIAQTDYVAMNRLRSQQVQVRRSDQLPGREGESCDRLPVPGRARQGHRN